MQCLRITFSMERIPDQFLEEKLQKAAHKFSLEGTVQLISPTTVKIIICGNRTSVEDFIDFIHHEVAEYVTGLIEVEPFSKQKDYRGVFRIIE